MDSRKTWAVAAGLALLTGGVAVASWAGSADAEELKIGTLAPKQSIWGQVFQVWETAVDKKTDGKLQLQFFYNGQQGDEAAMVGKMKAGQLDGAAITAVGLSKIYLPVLALQLPGALNTWDKLEAAQSQLRGEFETGIKNGGFDLLGWGNVGQAHFFTKGSSVTVPDDLKSKKIYVWRDDNIAPVLYNVVGATTVPLNVPEVLPQLRTGAVNALNAPALAVEQLQWGGELDGVSSDVTGCAIGALVFSSSKVAALPGDLREVLVSTGGFASMALGQKVKDEDGAAFTRLSGKMSVVNYSDSDRAAWSKVFAETRTRLGQGTFDSALIKKIEGIAGL
ncbi:MAG: TRAP transporter substrate-binding protein DctP [Polyangiaceae bacterium]